MVNFCAFIGCSSRGGRDKKSFYRLPAVRQSEGEKTRELSTKRRAKWLSQISRDIRPSNLQYTRVCSDHFINGKPADLYDETNPDWVPTLKLGYKSKERATLAGERYQRAVERKATRQKVEAASGFLDLQLPPADHIVHDDVTTERETGTASQTDLEGSSITAMKADYQNLLSEKLKEKLNSERKFDADFFVDNDERVKYYTEGTSRRELEEAVMDNFQDFLSTVEDNITGYTEALAWNEKDTITDENDILENKKYQAVDVSPAAVLGWLTGQKHRPVNGEPLNITAHFDHDCKERNPEHTICFPQVGACSREITFPVAHMTDVKEFEHVFLLALCKGGAFSNA
ncbi:uncharacterized protein LOC106160983 [Lingula anatina]|uniref:Uncharacterized protein LOC106160983 n=1 Tax=Lingula anatina TaxID=7574 RepID=A0A1S3I5Y4_LINAN|nr:uncharacterized protein LOC106160983 [Lingula anatina]|eukprot:XP_013393256.1 uncharacterized protein LOC106160983 [Lingula anatina]